MSAPVVLDTHGNPCRPYSGPPVAPVVSVECWLCSGTGWREDGMASPLSIVGHGHRCAVCAGTGYIVREVAP
ncbi:MAG TPA: hypothetical protein VMV87_01460 [Burkholderiales bacterium]|nr:hypothetical protein [Burkholderiales bacterium]